MSFITTPVVAPPIIAAEAADVKNVTGIITGSQVYLYAFEVQVPTSIASVGWGMGGTVTGTTNMGIYTAAGNLVAGSDTGARTNVANSQNNFSYATAVFLAPGQYWLAIACSNSTDTYLSTTLTAAAFTDSRHRVATNTLSAGALPSTTGAILATKVTMGVRAIPVGGLV